MANSLSGQVCRVLLVSVAVGLSIACSDLPPPCGNKTEIWFHSVVSNDECKDCMKFDFRTPILLESMFSVRDRPDQILGRCGVSGVRVHPDAVVLVLSPTAYRPLRAFRKALVSTSKNETVLVRLEHGESAVAVIFAEDIHSVMTLFDFDSIGFHRAIHFGCGLLFGVEGGIL